MKDVIIGIRLIVVLLVLCCAIYPGVLLGIAKVGFARQAEGSLITRDGKVIGSELVAQPFTSPRYFHPRPSAVAYNASGSAGSNYGPTNPALFSRMADSVTSATALDSLSTSSVAFDRVTASGSGLDPDITPENARQQAARVAAARGVDPAVVQELIQRNTSPPFLGYFGTSRVNVLELNLALDAGTVSGS